MARWASLLLLPALVLLAAAAAAAPVPETRPKGDHTEFSGDRMFVDSLVEPVAVTARECPGAVGRNCTRKCQLHICQALVDFYRVSNNASDRWDQEEGWVASETQTCEQLLAKPGQGGMPAYCGWHGVQCCDAGHVADKQCFLLGSVRGLNEQMNNLNVSLENPVLIRSLKTLHDCGLVIFDVESNNVAGRLTEEWGQLKHLQYLNIGTCWVSGTIPDGLQNMRQLRSLNLGNNWLNGSLPAWLSDLRLLRAIRLGSQFGDNDGTDSLGFQGTIPARIGELPLLRELVLESNSLTGHLPPDLCHRGASSLLVLNVRGNRLHGTAKEVEQCTKLVQLDLGGNQFTGSLPVTREWEQLATYSAGGNKFTGGWPAAMSELRILEYIDLSDNLLTGQLPPKITLLTSLKSVKLSNNRFSGTVVEDLYYIPSLSVLQLSNNRFVGTTPAAIGLSYSLSVLDLSNNSGITGELPQQLALLPRLQVVKMMQTGASCAGITKPYVVTTNNSCTDPEVCRTPQQFGNTAALTTKCAPDALLPCFLKFFDYSVPRDDDSNMKCKQIVRKPTEQARTDCEGALGEQAAAIPDKKWMAQWEIDPAYYQYQACECLQGYIAVWDDSGTVLACVEEKKSAQHNSIIIACTVAAVAVLAAALLLWRQYLRTRPRWLRERLLQAKRSKGPPKAKPGDKVLISIVVTDVKDFSDLTRRHPEVMNKAMGAHNNMLRKACHAHAGHVMDQEGDSWTIAFHDAEDAVAFALQVQQALAEKSWGLRLPTSSSSSHITTQAHMGSLTTQNSDRSAASSYGFMGPGTPSPAQGGGSGSGREPGAGSAAGNVRRQGSFSAASDDRANSLGKNSSLPGLRSQDCSFTSAGAGRGDDSSQPEAADVEAGLACGKMQQHEYGQQRRHQAGRQAACADDTRLSMDSSTQPQLQLQPLQPLQPLQQQQQQQQSTRSFKTGFGIFRPETSCDEGSPFGQLDSPTMQQLDGHAAAAPSSGSAASWRPASRLASAGSVFMQRLSQVVRGGLHSSLLQLLESHGAQELRLSVRMGVATGWLPYGCSLESSAVFVRAKNHVSEVANGGQVLIDSHTFRLVKHSLSELGTVEEDGYNDKQLQQRLQAQAVARMQRVACGSSCWSCCTSGKALKRFTPEDQPCDYDTDAIVVHMGGFSVAAPSSSSSTAAAAAAANGTMPRPNWTSEESSPSSQDSDGCDDEVPTAAAAAVPGKARQAGRRIGRHEHSREQVLQLQVYSIAAPKMRRPPQHTSDLQACMGWCQPVRLKQGWKQVQKDYFQAPGARWEDLVPSRLQDRSSCRPPQPAATFVFAEVPGAHSLAHRQHKAELHGLNKAIKRCMVQVMACLPGGDGYMCRCHEPDLRFMVAFESPVRAVEWCLLVQEALMYMEWPETILGMPGCEEVVHPHTGQLLLRGPRLRMGVSEGVPTSVLPDHMGHANYTGGAVNRAARFMDVAAHPGQVVCDIGFAERCFAAWSGPAGAADGLPGHQSWGSGLDCTSPESIPESAAATDWGDPQAHLMQLMALRSQSETSGHCRPATGPQGLRSRALHELWYRQQQLKQDQKGLYHRQQQQSVPERPGVGPAAAGPVVGSSSGWHTPPLGNGSSSRAGYPRAAAAAAPGASHGRFNPLTMAGGVGPMGYGYQLLPPMETDAERVTEPVTASFLGSFSFKGSGMYEMVQLQHTALLGRRFPDEPPKGKGTRLTAASGAVQGLQGVQLQIPARVLAARRTFRDRGIGRAQSPMS